MKNIALKLGIVLLAVFFMGFSLSAQDKKKEKILYFTRSAGYEHGAVKRKGDELSFSGIGLLLSRDPIDPEIATRAGYTAGFGVYRTREKPLLIAQISRYQREGEGELTIPGSLRDAQLLPVKRQQSQGDRIRFQLTPSPRETLLFVSQQHHPQWSAHSNGRTLATVRVNGFYQGVLLPPGTEQAMLEFRPFVRHSWIPQLGFGIAAVGALAWTLASRSRRRA